MTTTTMNVAAVVFVPASEQRPRRGQTSPPPGGGREERASDRVKEVTVLGTGGRLRHLVVMVGGEYATLGEMWARRRGRGNKFLLLSG